MINLGLYSHFFLHPLHSLHRPRCLKQKSQRDHRREMIFFDKISIQKNEREKEYLKMSQAHQSQNELLHRLQTKAAKVAELEGASKDQEKVIQKLERLLATKSKGTGLLIGAFCPAVHISHTNIQDPATCMTSLFFNLITYHVFSTYFIFIQRQSRLLRKIRLLTNTFYRSFLEVDNCKSFSDL